MLLALAAFVIVQVLIGFWAAGKVRSEDDFLVAGRRLGPALAAASIFATWFGAESLAAAGGAYESGWSVMTTEPLAYGACLVLMGLFFAAPLWRRRITTLADFFSQRFGASTERIAAVLLLPSSILWAAAQIRAFGGIVALNSDGLLDPTTATVIAAAVAIVYTTSGGLLADVYTDVVQGGVLIVGLVILGVVVFAQLDTAAPAPVPHVSLAAPASFGDVLERWAIPICGSLVAQEALSRSLAARSPTVARNGAVIGGSLYILVGLIPLGIGLVGPRLAPDLAQSEDLLSHLSRQLLPGALHVVFTAGVIAAILSTVDSCLLVVSSVVTRNLTRHSAPAAATGRLRLARVAAAAAGLVAFALACTGLNVSDLVEEASGFGSAGVFVLAVVGTYGRFGGALAANASLAAGLGTWVAGRYLASDHVGHPYLWSLAAAATGFSIGWAIERWRGRMPPRSPPAAG